MVGQGRENNCRGTNIGESGALGNLALAWFRRFVDRGPQRCGKPRRHDAIQER